MSPAPSAAPPAPVEAVPPEPPAPERPDGAKPLPRRGRHAGRRSRTPLGAFVCDSSLIFQRYLRQTMRAKVGLLFGAMQPLLVLYFFGPLLTDVQLGTGGDSWQVLVPGLLVQLGMFSAAFAGFGILVEKHHGVIERMRVTPVSRMALLTGRVMRDVVQLLAQSLLLVLAGVTMGLRAPLFGILIGFVFISMLTISLASLSYALAMRVNTPEEFAPVINAINLPVMLLSGILLPMALAPGWLDFVSHLVPLRYLVDAVRAAFLGDYGNATMLRGALVALGLAAVSVTVGSRLFRKAGA